MSEQFLGRCSICRGDIKYTEAESFVTCPACGKEQAVALFQREKIRLQQIKREKEQAQADLKAAQQEKQAAQENLNKAIAALADADFSKKQLEEITSQLGEDRRAFEQLMGGLQNGQSALLQTLRGSDGMQKKLQDLQSKVQFVLDMGFGNTQQLENVRDAAKTLLVGQNRFDARLATLQTTADETQKKLDALQTAWKQDKLDRVEELYRQAENARSEFRFEKAAEKYEELQLEGSKYARDPEIFWRMLLSHYGVKYQHSDAADGYVPTIFYPDLTDPAQMSLRRELFACCNAQQEKHYRQALDEIDKVLNRYRELRDATHYDVFISVKQADNYGHHTADSDKASTLYDQLTGWGLKVFNSRRTIIPAGQEFEPHIIAALMSAKVMIVVGTNPEYMDSDWVRNEWTRFQWLQKEEAQHGKNDRVLFCYLANGMQPHQLPAGLNPNMQAVMEDSSAGERLQNTMERIFRQKIVISFRKKAEQPSAGHFAPAFDVSDQLKLMQVWLKMGKFEQVTAKYDELINNGKGISDAYVYLYALCAAHKKENIDQLAESDIDFSQEKLYRFATSFAADQQPLEALRLRNQIWREKIAAECKHQEEKRRRAEEELRQQAKERRMQEEKRRLQEEKRRQQEENAARFLKNFVCAELPDGTVEVVKFTGKETQLTIPEYIDGKKVTSIGDNAFYYRSNLTSIHFSDSITHIGSGAFWGCTGLTSFVMPDSIVTIGDHAFYACYNLEDVTVSKNLIGIPNSAFYDCDKLSNIVFPANMVSIGENAFCDCDKLTTLVLPDTITYIGVHAFSRCPKLTLQVEKNSYAHNYAKDNNLRCKLPAADELTQSSVSKADSQPIVLFDEALRGDISKYQYALLADGTIEILKYLGKETQLFVPEYIDGKKVTRIGDNAFYYRSNLTNVHLPDSIISIGSCAFWGCTGLTAIVLPHNVSTVGNFAFYSCYGLKNIRMSENLEKIADFAFYDCDALTDIVLPDSVSSIGSSAFQDCDRLIGIKLTNSVSHIGGNAFSRCPNLTINVENGSYAHNYAVENGIVFELISENMA